MLLACTLVAAQLFASKASDKVLASKLIVLGRILSVCVPFYISKIKLNKYNNSLIYFF